MFEAVTRELRECDLITNIDLDGCTGTAALQHGGRNCLLLFTRALIPMPSLPPPVLFFPAVVLGVLYLAGGLRPQLSTTILTCTAQCPMRQP